MKSVLSVSFGLIATTRSTVAALALFSSAVCSQPAVPIDSTSAAQMTVEALEFLRALDDQQRDIVSFPLESNERGRWSNLPTSFYRRTGLRLGELESEQRIAFHDLLRASTSSQGYLKIVSIIQMDQFLKEISESRPADLRGIERGAPWPGLVTEEPPLPPELAEQRNRANAAFEEESIRSAGNRGVPTSGFGSDNYFVSIFGDPSENGDWAWLLGGHHLAASFTVSQGRVSFTPLFLGSQPHAVLRGINTGLTPLSHESARGFELMQALSPDQQRIARVSSERAYDVLSGPGRRQSLGRVEGLPASRMTPEQQRLLRVLVDEFVRNADFDTADDQLAAIERAGWENVSFSWRGPTGDPDGLFYYRVHGPRILIEFVWERRNHSHAIVRDPGNDYGEDWLGAHYEEQHPDTSDVMDAAILRTQFLEEQYQQRSTEAR